MTQPNSFLPSLMPNSTGSHLSMSLPSPLTFDPNIAFAAPFSIMPTSTQSPLLPYSLPNLSGFGGLSPWLGMGLPSTSGLAPQPKATQRSSQAAPQLNTPRRQSPSPTPKPTLNATPLVSPKSPVMPALLKLSKAQLKGLIKSWPTLTAEAQQAYRDQLPHYFQNQKFAGLLKAAEEAHQQRQEEAQKPVAALQRISAVQEITLHEEEAEDIPGYIEPPLVTIIPDLTSFSPSQQMRVQHLAQREGLLEEPETALCLHATVQQRIADLVKRLIYFADMRHDVYRHKTHIRAEPVNPQWALVPNAPLQPEVLIPKSAPNDGETSPSNATGKRSRGEQAMDVVQKKLQQIEAKRQKLEETVAITQRLALQEVGIPAPQANEEDEDMTDAERELRDQCELLQRKWEELQELDNAEMQELVMAKLSSKQQELARTTHERLEERAREVVISEEQLAREAIEVEISETSAPVMDTKMASTPSGPLRISFTDMLRLLHTLHLPEAPYLLEDLLPRGR